MTAQETLDISQVFQKSRRILIAVHERADGDALGSMLALAEHLRLLKKDVITFSHDGVSESFDFLPGSDRVVQTLPESLGDIDAIVLLDCGDMRRTHIPFDRVKDAVVVNIDHHPTNTQYGGRNVVKINAVNTRASSTCELVYDYLIQSRAAITKDIATCLLTGICTDTSNFQNLGTTQTCLIAASKLLLYGASLPKIVEATFRNKSVGVLKLWGRALSRLKKDERSGIVTTVISQDDITECGVEMDSTEGIANFLNSLDEARVILVLKEDGAGIIRGSYRTTKPDVDVSVLAKQYGGGGHKKAAGFSVSGRLEETASGWRIVPLT